MIVGPFERPRAESAALVREGRASVASVDELVRAGAPNSFEESRECRGSVLLAGGPGGGSFRSSGIKLPLLRRFSSFS